MYERHRLPGPLMAISLAILILAIFFMFKLSKENKAIPSKLKIEHAEVVKPEPSEF